MSGLEALLAGRVLVKRYRIEEVVGRGGFAAVYRADDLRLGRPVAVKVITLTAADAALREQLRERFQREARAAAGLPHHPNLVTVHDFGTDPELDLDFLVMELLVGEDLATHLADQGRPPLEVSLAVLHDAALGLAVGHREGLVHRDVKPGNLFLAEPHGGEPFRLCVLDYGIARLQEEDENTRSRLTQDGNTPLSPAYASPEQLRGETHLTPASDVFSLGVVGYQLLTGEKPFAGERRRREGEAQPVRPVRELAPDVPAAVEAVVMRALAERPEDRYADAGEMALALEAATSGSGRRADDETVVSPAPAVVIAAAPAAPEVDEATLIQAPAAAPISPVAPPRPEGRPPAPPVGRTSPPPPPAPRRRGLPMALLGLLLLAGAAFGGWMLLGGGGSRDAGAAPVTAADDTLPAASGAVPAGGEGAVPLDTTGAADPAGVASPSDDGSAPAQPSGGGASAGETTGGTGSPSPGTMTAPPVARPAPAPGATTPARPAPAAPAPRPSVPQPQRPQPAPQPRPQPQRPPVQRPTPQRPVPQRPAPRPQPAPQPQPQPQAPAPQPQPTPQPLPPAPQPLPLPTPQPLPGYPDTIIIRPVPAPPLPGAPSGPAAPIAP